MPPTSAGTLSFQTTEVPKFEKAQRGFNPPKMVYYTVEGFGKTTFAAFAPKPIFITAPLEDGYYTLLNSGTVPECMATVASNFNEFLAVLRAILDGEVEGKTVVVDSIGWFEQMLHTAVCNSTFSSSWDKFFDFRKGPERSLPQWIDVLNILSRINREKKMMIILLSHARRRNVKNTHGSDYGSMSSDTDTINCWEPTKRWADVVLFGDFLTLIDPSTEGDRKVAKAIGGKQRIIYTQHADAHDAKNRYSLEPQITLPAIERGGDMSVIWKSVWNGILESNKAKGKP